MATKTISAKNRALWLGLILSFITFMHAVTTFAGTITLTWDTPTTNTDGSPLADLSGYKIYYGTTSGSYTNTINVGKVTTSVVNNLTAGLTYYFAVTDYNSSGVESSYSNGVSKTVPASQFTLTTTKTGTGTGTLTSSPAGITCGAACTGTFNAGTLVTLTASPDASSIFGGWSGACSGTGACTIPLDAAKTVTATFTLKTFAITATATIGGTITPAGATTVTYGANQTITIAPSAGYHVATVLVDGVSKGAVTTYTFAGVTANHTIAASFAINSYAITASAGTGGAISPPGAVSANYGGNAIFSISPNAGYKATDVKVDGVSKGAVTTYTFTSVTANHTIAASFAINTYTITATGGAGGSITPPGSVTVNNGASQTYSIVPNAGYGVANVVADGASVGAVATYTFSNVTANHTISASFAANSFTITPTAGAGGAISPATAFSLSSGSSRTVTITPSAGYHVATVLVDGVSKGAITTYTFTGVTANHTIAASFAINSYIITASAGTGGAISPPGAVSANYGGNAIFSITPNTGYKATDVKVDGVSKGAVTTYTFASVTTSHIISATFGALPVSASLTCPDPGIPCVERTDGLPDGNNLVNNKPKVDVEFEFRTTVVDTKGVPQYVRLFMTQRSAPVPGDFYRYDMNCSGNFSTGAICNYKTELGPAANHKFYIEAKLSDGSIVVYPKAGFIAGPQIQMLNGYNYVGAPRDFGGVWLDGTHAFGTASTYRWIPGGTTTNPGAGYFDVVDTTKPPVKQGEGYLVMRSINPALPGLDLYPNEVDITSTISLQPGWNIISNPYGGNIKLADIQVQKGTNAAISWTVAVSNTWLNNSVAYFIGSDWGNSFSVESTGGTTDAILVPWRAYWVYLNKADAAYSLVIHKP